MEALILAYELQAGIIVKPKYTQMMPSVISLNIDPYHGRGIIISRLQGEIVDAHGYCPRLDHIRDTEQPKS